MEVGMRDGVTVGGRVGERVEGLYRGFGGSFCWKLERRLEEYYGDGWREGAVIMVRVEGNWGGLRVSIGGWSRVL